MKLKTMFSVAALAAVFVFAGRCDQEVLCDVQGLRTERAQIVGYVIQTEDGNLWECNVMNDCTVTFRGDEIVNVK